MLARDDGRQVATERYYIINGESGQVSHYAASIQGYSNDEFVGLLVDSGFGGITRIPSLVGPEGEEDDNYVVLVAEDMGAAGDREPVARQPGAKRPGCAWY